MNNTKKILVLTGGGDCPGLNAVIRGIAKRARKEKDWEVYGSIEAFNGVFNDPQEIIRLTSRRTAGIHVKGLSKGDTFMWSPEQAVRNLVHDPALAEKMLAEPLSDEQQFAAMKNRLTMAQLTWQPRLYNPHLYKWLHRIGVPTLILWGDDDRIIPPGYGPAFRDLIPGARLETIANCGHLPQIERMEEWTDRISSFIAGVAP